MRTPFSILFLLGKVALVIIAVAILLALLVLLFLALWMSWESAHGRNPFL